MVGLNTSTRISTCHSKSQLNFTPPWGAKAFSYEIINKEQKSHSEQKAVRMSSPNRGLEVIFFFNSLN